MLTKCLMMLLNNLCKLILPAEEVRGNVLSWPQQVDQADPPSSCQADSLHRSAPRSARNWWIILARHPSSQLVTSSTS